jgi:uncharacterized protein YkwD
MKNFTSLIVVLLISFATTAGDWPYNRLERLYHTNPSKCLKVAKRYIKRSPDNAVPYYFASLVYRDKTKTHQEDKTRYMMMSKSIGYAMKFEALEDTDLMLKVKWDDYLVELEEVTYGLMDELALVDMENLGDRLGSKHQKMIDQRGEYVIIAATDHGETLTPPPSSGSQAGNPAIDHGSQSESTPTVEEPVVVDNSEKKGYYGLASGRELTPSYNKIQEKLLLEMINEEREALFMQPLRWNDDLARAARYHAYDMAQQDYFLPNTYDRINGALVEIADANARNGQFYEIHKIDAMNMASSCINADETFKQWLNFDEQYDAMFDESSKKVGIGLAHDPDSECGYYWVLITAHK